MSVFAKPTFFQAFLPAAGLYGLWLLFLKYKGCYRFFGQILLAFLPALSLFAFSYLYYAVISPMGSGLGLGFSLNRLWVATRNTVLTSAFPLIVLALCGKGRCKGNHAVWLAVLTMLCAALEYVFFEELGPRAGDGNMHWAMMSASALLWACTVPLYRNWLRELRAKGRLSLWQGVGLCGSALVLAYHLASGINFIICQFSALSST